jgi:hypothetical protein
VAARDDGALDLRVSKKRTDIQRLAETIRKAREIAASIDSDRVSSSIMLDEADGAAIEIAADLVYLEQRLAELSYSGLKAGGGHSAEPDEEP